MLTFKNNNIIFNLFIIVLLNIAANKYVFGFIIELKCTTDFAYNQSSKNEIFKCNELAVPHTNTRYDYEQDTISIRKAQAAVKPKTCAEAVQPGYPSGIYQIYPDNYSPIGFPVYCLIDPYRGGSAWTLVQRRQDGSVNFHRNWNTYRSGFGDLNEEFFIGLDKLHLLTTTRRMELWVQLEDFEGDTRYAIYKTFIVGDEHSNFVLNIGNYNGNAGDDFIRNNERPFQTFDKYLNTHKCPIAHRGAWWYGGCGYVSLNGLYLAKSVREADGIWWNSFRGFHYSLKYVHMAIRAY